VSAALARTDGKGVDAVIIAASAKDDDIVHQAAQACRKKGRIVLVGVVDLSLRRGDFYEKELTFQVSCSYGPGRYDEKYEQAGQDYPLGFVRWTEQRNFEAVLEAMRSRQLQVTKLITHRLELDKAAESYDQVLHDPNALGIVIEYPTFRQTHGEKVSSDYDRIKDKNGTATIFTGIKKGSTSLSPSMGVIGAGNYARSILLPALARTKSILAAVADINGIAAAHAARKFGAERVVSDYRLLLEDTEIQAVFVLVGHHLHAQFVCEVLKAGKHVFVEKPLAITSDQLAEVIQTHEKTGDIPISPMVMVGFNRRFSPHVVRIKELLEGRTEPLCMVMTVNAGFIPPQHWVQDPARGGGRIIGEGCHFIDLLSHLAGSPVTSVSAVMVGGNGPIREDKMSIMLSFVDGSIGTVHYFANGSKGYPKETLEVFGDGRVIRMENFRMTKGFGFKGFNSFRTWRQDKGHRAEIAAFVERVSTGGTSLITFEEIVNVTKASFAAVESAKSHRTIQL
jgi:predicted dehydrogenase